ncbi:MAG: UDP-N-acetylmuramate dehydrogenase [Candidatus Pacebacteria bacterium]|nr:UDP-N-acetylmuramate dehydrogenase [Candidatus Paceibacterota bacterium]
MTLTIHEQVSLAPHTTFKIGGPARFFCIIRNEADLVQAVAFANECKASLFVLGGGSNVLMSDKGFDGVVIKMEIEGVQKIQNPKSKIQNDSSTIVSAGAGVQWDTLVEYVVEWGLYGLENLSAIPGTVGAAPVQNIGAYGVEVAGTVQSVRAYDLKTSAFVELSNADCHFSYRDSIFKKEKGRYIITRVDFSLKKDGAVNLEYKDVKEYFSQKDIANPSLKEVRDAVIDIRWNKLPDWKLWGTAGSFFKNPIICTEHYQGLKKVYPDLPGYPEGDGVVKVPLGWILDRICNLKGACIGNVCVYEKQALVLVAKSGATSEEVVKLAHTIIDTVKEKTGIDIEGEVEWVN